MTREDKYKAQLVELGIYQEAFDPVIKDLCRAERRRTRAENEWSAKAKAEAADRGEDPTKAKPSFLDSLWGVICDLDKSIMVYRETLGLTPKALRRLRGQPTAAAGPTAGEEISAKLDRMLEREEPERSWSFEQMAAAVSNLDTGTTPIDSGGEPDG